MKRKWLKPSSVIPISFKATVYEDHLLRLIALKCGVSKSFIVRVALLRLLVSLIRDSGLKKELTPGYDYILEQMSSEVEEILNKCISKLK